MTCKSCGQEARAPDPLRFGERISRFEIRGPRFGVRVVRSGYRVSGFGFQVLVVGFRVSGFDCGFQVSGSEFRVPGVGCRVSGSRFRVSGSGFRVLGFGVTPSASRGESRQSLTYSKLYIVAWHMHPTIPNSALLQRGGVRKFQTYLRLIDVCITRL